MAGKQTVNNKLFKSKSPLRKVDSDDFVMKEGDEEYRPHYGESVWFTGKPTVGEQMAFMELQEKYAQANATEESAALIFDQLKIICNILSRAIKKWTWTDNDDNPLPQVPASEDILALTIDEISYLFSAYNGVNDPEMVAQRKNA